MSKIKLKNVENSELEFLKNKLYCYHKYKEAALKCDGKNNFETLVNEMLLIDLSRTLWYNFGQKIVSNFHLRKTPFTNLSLSVSEAAILVASLNFSPTSVIDNEFETYTAGKYSDLLLKLLQNSII